MLNDLFGIVYANVYVQLSICILLMMLILLFRHDWLVFLPIIPYTGFFLYNADNLREIIFISSFFEVIMLCILCIKFLNNKNKHINYYFIILGISAMPSLINSKGHVLLSAYFIFCMIFTAFFYHYAIKYSHRNYQNFNYDKLAVLLLVLGIAIKIWIGIRLGESFLIQRGGGILGSNSIWPFLLLIFPFVRKNIIKVAIISFSLLQFSRGIYLAMVFYILIYLLLFNTKSIKPLLFASSIIATIFGILSNYLGRNIMTENQSIPLMQFIFARFRLSDNFLLNFWEGVRYDQRFEIFSYGVDFIKKYNYTGYGPAGAYFEFKNIGYAFDFSNLHNIFLNVLAEGGLLHLLIFISMITYYLYKSFRVKKEIFIVLLTWLVYLQTTGELYSSSGMATCIQLYLLSFIFAEIDLMAKGIKFKI